MHEISNVSLIMYIKETLEISIQGRAHIEKRRSTRINIYLPVLHILVQKSQEVQQPERLAGLIIETFFPSRNSMTVSNTD